MTGRLEKILYVDLTEKSTWTRSRPELFEKYIGGAGVASKLLLESPPGNDPQSPEAPIILATGPLAGIFPNMTKAVAMFKSPLTGNLGESYAGGNLSIALRFTEYGAVVTRGSSNNPVSLIIEKENVRVEDASSLWGRSPPEVEGVIHRRNRQATRSVITIGRAGENGVNYACTIVDRYSHFGRLGLGAIMGSKKLKAICVCSNDELDLGNESRFLGLRNDIDRLINEAHSMKKYKDLGTAANVLPLNALGALPSKNFSRSTYDKANELSGENFARQVLDKKTTCPTCSVACIHLGKPSSIRPSQHQEHDAAASSESEPVPYNYQPIFALGTNLDVSDPNEVLRLIGRCERLGMDAIMMGAVLGWATEAHEKGLTSTHETLGLTPEWGSTDTYLEMIENTANALNEYYNALAHGVDAAAQKYGGKDFAVTLGRNSPAGYLTGYGHVVGTLVGARHSHLSNAGYSIDQTAMLTNMGPERIVNALVEEEDWLNVLNSLITCYFSRDIYVMEIVVKALAAVGINRTTNELTRLGREISSNLYNYKIREGFDLTKENISKRLLEVEGPKGRLNPEIIQSMISHYVKIRERANLELCPA